MTSYQRYLRTGNMWQTGHTLLPLFAVHLPCPSFHLSPLLLFKLGILSLELRTEGFSCKLMHRTFAAECYATSRRYAPVRLVQIRHEFSRRCCRQIRLLPSTFILRATPTSLDPTRLWASDCLFSRRCGSSRPSTSTRPVPISNPPKTVPTIVLLVTPKV